jgi:hypothetical protein
MAVELAKVSLWLHTFTVGAPLSFLDHHLRCGDSLFGEMVRPVENFLHDRGSLALATALAAAKGSARAMIKIEEMSDADLGEISQSETSFAEVDSAVKPLNGFLDFFHALRWLDRLPKKAKKLKPSGRMATPVANDPAVNIFDGALGNPVQVIAGRGSAVLTAKPTAGRLFPGGKPEQIELAHPVMNAERQREALELIAKAQAISRRERFLHWQVAFPGVWENWESVEPTGGFDAVISNPPWDRIKLQEVEWFATRRESVAKQQRASDRKKQIAKLKKNGDALYADYELATEAAEAAARVSRDAGYYPKLSAGDINIYSLFVERAHALLKPDGLVGLLVPSGIAADLGAAEFFGEVATSGRLAALFDFENRKVFFPDVHASFKFSVFVTTGPKRRVPRTAMGFFLHSIAEIADPNRVVDLSAKDFARVNPQHQDCAHISDSPRRRDRPPHLRASACLE